MKKTLELLCRVDLDDPTAYDCALEILFSIPELTVYTVPIDLRNGDLVFRSRQNEGQQNFNLISDISYPPIESLKSFGRMNRPFQNIFYCSDNRVTNFTELMPNWLRNVPNGDIISITCGQWKIIENLKIIVIPDFQNKKMIPFMEKSKINDLDEDSRLLLKFINQLFLINDVNDKKLYIITSAFCNVIRTHFKNLNIPFDGILYTSAQDRRGYNIALNTEVIDNCKVKLMSVLKHFIYKRDNTPIYDNFIPPIEPLKIDFERGQLIW